MYSVLLMASEVLRLIESSAKNPDPKKVFGPRLLIVDGANTDVESGKRTVNLVLMNRAASAEFKRRFPKVTNITTALQFAHGNSLAFMGKGAGDRPHTKTHYFPGTNFPIGHVLTEKQAYDLGYTDPHMDTVCAQIARVAEYLCRHGKSSELAQALKEAGLIDQRYFVTLTPDVTWEHTLDVLKHDPSHAEIPGVVCRSHPIRLYIFRREENSFSVGGAYHVPGTKIANEFCIAVPALEG
jgi:hypothetical protein